MSLLKKIFFITIVFLSFISHAGIIEERLSYAESLNNKNDLEMFRISDSILNVLNPHSENFELNLYKATYLKVRVLNRQGHIKEALTILDSVSSIHPNPTISNDYGNLFLLKGILYKKKANPELTLQNYNRSIQIFEELQSCKSLIKARNNLANYYNSLSNYSQAIEQYKNCLNLLVNCPNPFQRAIINRNLAGLYFNYEKDYEKGIIHFQEALLQFQNLESNSKIDNLILGVLNELTFLFLQDNNISEAKKHSLQTKKLIKDNTPVHNVYKYKLNRAKLLLKQNRKTEGNQVYKEINQLIEHNKSLTNYKTGFYIELANYYQSVGRNKLANDYLNKALDLALIQKKTEILSNIYLSKSRIFEKQGHFQESLVTLNKYLELKDQTFNQKNSQIIQNNKFNIENIKKETEYKLERHKQQEEIQLGVIAQNKLENDKLRILIITISTIVILLILLFWIYSQRKRISIKKLLLESQNKELELELNNKNQEEDYKLFHHTMKAKKEEQNRISRNLHDNIGANLAAIKLALDGEKDKPFSDLIDDVYKEVRNLSYELSESKGLFKQMIHTYLKNIEKATGLEIHFEVVQDVNLEEIYSVKKREIFSIIREIVQNTMKHSESSKMDIVISEENRFLHLYTEDFGKGFEVENIELGLGLTNIKKRVTLLKGNFDLDARVGRGVIININIPI